MPVPATEPLLPHGARHSRPRNHWLQGFHQRTVFNAGFTLVEVVVSSSILAFALAGSFRGWSQAQDLVRQANQRQALLDAVAQDLERQQGFVIQKLDQPPWACELALSELRTALEPFSSGLPEAVERQLSMQGQPPALTVRYTAANLKAPRERLLALSGGGPVCDKTT